MLWHREQLAANPRSRLEAKLQKMNDELIVKQARAKHRKEQRLQVIPGRGMKYDGYGHSALVPTSG